MPDIDFDWIWWAVLGAVFALSCAAALLAHRHVRRNGPPPKSPEQERLEAEFAQLERAVAEHFRPTLERLAAWMEKMGKP